MDGISLTYPKISLNVDTIAVWLVLNRIFKNNWLGFVSALCVLVPN